jgi:hypothetical protein
LKGSFHLLFPVLTSSRLGTAAPARISTKKIKVKAPKEPKPAITKYKGTSQGPRMALDKLVNLRSDDTAGSVKSPSTPTETSSSEEEPSSEEESEYEEDEDMPVKDISEVSFLTPRNIHSPATASFVKSSLPKCSRISCHVSLA